jgi:Zn-dependent peptidase ImmA (M78 family)/transcriptional regulator with XRE-family HTH domain
MLILARESRRMTQKALADASSTKQASVSRAEAGVHEPQSATLQSWARALRYPEEFFSHRSEAPPLPRLYWRKQVKLGKLDQRAIVSRIAITCMNIQALVRSVEMPDADAPGITLGVGSRSASEAARHLRTQWRVQPGPIEDLTQLVESNGILVVMLPSAEGFQGVSIRDARKDLPPVIFLSADDPVDRQRWTMAHEVGHIVLHHHLPSVGNHTEDELEDEANEFAGEFLMPANEIRHQFTWRTDLAELAQMKLHWRTSMMALIRRGRRLERITENQAKRLYVLMSKSGYRTDEPNRLSPEPPATLSELLRVHIEELGFSESELATLLALDLEDVRMNYLGAVAQAPPEETPPRPRLRIV